MIWKDVVGYEGIYEVSNDGQVRSTEGKTTFTKRHGVRVWKSRVLKEKNPLGREVRVSLWKNGQERSWLVHQLVAKAFIPNAENHKCINHLDGNPRNNNVNNLEWCDHYINNNHAFDNRLIKTGKITKLVNLKTGKEYIFRSQTKAGEFLGRSHGYLADKKIADGYEVFFYD